eukprot:277636-Amphidinium_carterae.1
MQSVRERRVAEEMAGATMREVEQSAMQQRVRSEHDAEQIMRQVESRAVQAHELALKEFATRAEKELANRVAAQITESDRIREVSALECAEARCALTTQAARHTHDLAQMRGVTSMHVTHELEAASAKHGQEVMLLTRQLEEAHQQLMAVQMNAGRAKQTSENGSNSNGRWRRHANQGGGPPPYDPNGSGAGGDAGGGGGGGSYIMMGDRAAECVS